MLIQYWHTANGAGLTLKQHWDNSSCFLRERRHFDARVSSVSGWNRQNSDQYTHCHFLPMFRYEAIYSRTAIYRRTAPRSAYQPANIL